MIPGEPLIRWDWIASHLDEYAFRLVEHVQLTVIAVGVGFVIAFALSLLILRMPRTETPITWVTGTLYTIPSLALFVILVPYTGFTILTAEIGLVSYTLLILIRNIVRGIRGVPAEVREAAVGMGYAPREMLWRIELPLALAVIMAGVRLATITTIGLVTVTSLIGQGGFGFLILIGIQRFFTTELIAGAVLSVALAVVADALLVLLQRRLTPWARAA
ncbi:MAG TPA: ABC transporter permease [Candidatus Limnocylindria bacterium]|nr:ABC transporter permease [Candidatus Limnocylindria bacterium]